MSRLIASAGIRGAHKIAKDAEVLGGHTGFKIGLAYGGTGYERQRRTGGEARRGDEDEECRGQGCWQLVLNNEPSHDKRQQHEPAEKSEPTDKSCKCHRARVRKCLCRHRKWVHTGQ